jgi:hypothetical protein
MMLLFAPRACSRCAWQVLTSSNRFAFYDGKLPPLLPLLPTHPAAKRSDDISDRDLDKERRELSKNVREYNATATDPAKPVRARNHASHYTHEYAHLLEVVEEEIARRAIRKASA